MPGLNPGFPEDPSGDPEEAFPELEAAYLPHNENSFFWGENREGFKGRDGFLFALVFSAKAEKVMGFAGIDRVLGKWPRVSLGHGEARES